LKHAKQHHNQRGAVTVEFALLFMLFFALFYSLVSYGLVIFIKQGLTQAAAEGVRASIRLDPANFSTVASYENAARDLAKSQVNLTLASLPKPMQDAFTAHGTVVVDFAPSVKIVTTGGKPLPINTNTITVTASYLNYKQFPMIPVLKWFDNSSGQALALPPLPQDLIGKSSFQLQQ
jgi:Flp pilus assembly protein TadG